MIQTLFPLLSVLCSSALCFQTILPEKPLNAELAQCPLLSDKYERMARVVDQSLAPLKIYDECRPAEDEDILSALIDTLPNNTNVRVWIKAPLIYTRTTLILSIGMECRQTIGYLHFIMDINLSTKCMKIAIEAPGSTEWKFLNPLNCPLIRNSYRYTIYVVEINYIAFECRSRVHNEDEPAYFIAFALNQTQSFTNSCWPDEEHRLQQFFSTINECSIQQVEKLDAKYIVIIVIGIVATVPVCAIFVTKVINNWED